MQSSYLKSKHKMSRNSLSMYLTSGSDPGGVRTRRPLTAADLCFYAQNANFFLCFLRSLRSR